MGTLLVIGGIPSLGMGHLNDFLNTFLLPIEFAVSPLKIIRLSRRLGLHAGTSMSESEISCPFPNTQIQPRSGERMQPTAQAVGGEWKMSQAPEGRKRSRLRGDCTRSNAHSFPRMEIGRRVP